MNFNRSLSRLQGKREKSGSRLNKKRLNEAWTINSAIYQRGIGVEDDEAER